MEESTDGINQYLISPKKIFTIRTHDVFLDTWLPTIQIILPISPADKKVQEMNFIIWTHLALLHDNAQVW